MSSSVLNLAEEKKPTPGIPRATRELVVEVPFLTPQSLNRDAFSAFEAHPRLVGLPVVEAERPIGLINRNLFMQSLARPFYREVFLGKPCTAFMDTAPLLVDEATSIQDLSYMALAAGEKALADGYIVTGKGKYLGMGFGLDMVRAIADLQAERNRQVMESIDYASVIQKSLGRASREALRRTLPDHFLLWEPRDVVSGDYFHFEARDGGFFAALFDCTGHGVPGAFMTMIMSSFLQNALATSDWRDPAALLTRVNRRVKTALGQIDHRHADAGTEAEHASDDGMDAAFMAFDSERRILTFAGAHMPLFLLPPGASEVEVIDGDRAGVGYAATAMEQAWTNQQREIAPGTACYSFTDGVFDQLGGPRRIAFGKKRLTAVLQARRRDAMPVQRQAILETLIAYQGEERRRDDVAGLGLAL